MFKKIIYVKSSYILTHLYNLIGLNETRDY